MNVSREVAAFFSEQCYGTHNGHMAEIPNNPVISGLLMAHGVDRNEYFIEFLRKAADALEGEK